MKTQSVILVGFLLSLPIIFILASTIEQGDTNAVSMYFVVFIIPCLVCAILNGLYIRIINTMTNKAMKVLLSLIPIVVLGLLSLSNNLTIPNIDGNIVFAAKVSAIALGVTNLLWLSRIFTPKTI